MKLLYEMLKMTATKNETKLWFLGVQIFGVKSVPAKFITLMKCHTEKGEYGGLFIQSSGSHGGTVGA